MKRKSGNLSGRKGLLKRKAMILSIACAAAFGLSGCGNKEEASTAAPVVADTAADATEATEPTISLQEEIIRFVGTDIASISSERDEAVELFNAYFAEGTNQDSDRWMTTLSEQALPKYDSYLKKLNAIQVVNEDVGTLKRLYVESSDLQRAAIEDVINAIKNADTTLLEYAQNKVNESRQKLENYETTLRNLCDANSIVLQGNVVPTEQVTEEITEENTAENTEADPQ